MTVHVSVRSISALLLLSVSLLGLPAGAPAQSVVAPQQTAPTLAERLDRLAAEFDRNRIDLHVPGAVLAIVRGEDVIFARGFGVADVEKKTPVTPETPFFIGSTTKAFTATLVGMLVDEGRMQWDDPVEKYLPEFKLKVQSNDPNDRATLRDVLSHRTGFTRMGFLEINTGLSSDEILRRASSAEAIAPFRQRFLYNNVHYLAAGSAAAVAAGTSWHALVKARILAPLGMTATRTSLREAWNDPRTARGYSWDEAGSEHPAGDARDDGDQHRRHRAGRRDQFHGPRHDVVASFPAAPGRPGRQSARSALRRSRPPGRRRFRSAARRGYGMGWFVRDWQGQRLIEHGGAIAGYSAEVGLLPDSKIGFVVLTNTLSALPSIATQLVPQYLLGELPPAASDVGDLKPYLGRYIANFAAFSNEVFTISERNRRLVLDIPSQLESALNPPRADGRWPLVMTDQLAVSFDRDKTGRVVGLKLHEAGHASSRFHAKASCSRRRSRSASCRSTWAATVMPPARTSFAILIRNQRLAVRLPNNTSFDLLPPDATGRRATRANVGLAVTFEESPTGAVSAMNFQRPGALPVMRLTPVASTLPTVDEIMTLRRIPAASASATMRTTGSVRFPQSGVEGRFSSSTAGDDRLRTDLDLDGSVQIRTVLNKGRASAAVSGALSRELTGKQLAQMRLGHPSVLFGDWRKYYDTVRVVRAGELGGRKVYGVQLESAGLPPALVAVDAETGDVLQTRQTMWFAEAGAWRYRSRRRTRTTARSAGCACPTAT